MRRYILTVIFLGCAAAVIAQKGFAINKLFDGRYRKAPNAVETTIRGDLLNGDYDISLYRSISITGDGGDADVIEPLVTSDGKRAIDSEVSYKGGQLYYVFYQLPASDTHKYLLYINRHRAGGDKIVLMYIEGDVTMRQLKKMFKHK